MSWVELSEQLSYYRASLRVLQFCEARRGTGRRFGGDADESWKLFRGDLHTADRIDLLIRDADSQWPRAFGARTVFDFSGVAEDEAFGAEWDPPTSVVAEELWRAVSAESAPESAAKALGAIAESWGIELAPIEIPPITPTSQFVAIGPRAIAALIVGFANASDVDWSAQVHCIATPPAHRHLAAAAAALLNLTKPTALLSASQAAEALQAKSALTGTLVASEDASDVQLDKDKAEPGPTDHSIVAAIAEKSGVSR